MEKLILIDGNAILHRAYHAMPPFRLPSGELVNAVYGFASMLLNLLNGQKPNYIAVSFDVKGKTFRHVEYSEYKATRTKAPDDLYTQLPLIKKLVQTFEIPIYELEGFEADDVLGTLAAQADQTGKLHTYLVSGDMDLCQLITDTTHMLAPFKGFKETITYDVPKVLAKYGLTPAQITDMKGLQGDSSDNIKGVQGVGPKTTKTLLQKYGTLENLYQNLHEITGKLQERLHDGHESAILSKRLATIITDAPITLDLANCTAHEYDSGKVFELFNELQFKSLIPKLANFDRHSSATRIEESQTQPSLF